MFQPPQIPNFETLVRERNQHNSQILQGQMGGGNQTEEERRRRMMARLLLEGAPKTGPVDSFGEMMGSLAQSGIGAYQGFQQNRQNKAQQALAPARAGIASGKIGGLF